MIDQDVIRLASAHSLRQLDSRCTIQPHALYRLDNFLDPLLISRVLNYITNNDIRWEEDTSQPGVNRKKINWEFDTPIEELYNTMNLLTDSINQIFNRDNKFLGITVWKDEIGYKIKKHTDNPVIDIAMQIYLTADPAIDAGTTFIVDNEHIQLPYKENVGYLMDNTANIEHYMTGNIPNRHVRYSLYAIWSRP